MKVASDLGGVGGFGRVEAETDEPVFHAQWEGRVLALTLAMGATRSWTLDGSRFAREDRPRDEYLGLTYYEIWLAALERLIISSGLADPEEVRSGRMTHEPVPVAARLEADQVAAVLRRGGPVAREAESAPRFAVGDRVRSKSFDPPGHTRLPAYARGKAGVVTAVHGCHVFPDTNAHDQGEQPQWLYNVEFEAVELFGATADPLSKVSVDAFEPYLEAL